MDVIGIYILWKKKSLCLILTTMFSPEVCATVCTVNVVKAFAVPKLNQGFVLPKHNQIVWVQKLMMYFAKLNSTKCLWFANWTEFDVQRWAMKQEMTAAPTEYKTWTERAGVEMCGETIWFSNVL